MTMTWKCPNCGGLLTTESTPPVHTPQGPVYVATGECPDCGEPLSDDWTRVDDE